MAISSFVWLGSDDSFDWVGQESQAIAAGYRNPDDSNLGNQQLQALYFPHYYCTDY